MQELFMKKERKKIKKEKKKKGWKKWTSVRDIKNNGYLDARLKKEVNKIAPTL
jgi:hypothetical protein